MMRTTIIQRSDRAKYISLAVVDSIISKTGANHLSVVNDELIFESADFASVVPMLLYKLVIR